MLDSIKKKYLMIGIPALFIMFVFLLWGMSIVLEKTSSPEFCNSCHVMNSQYESWFMTGLHRNIKCVDCHLPNNNTANHIIWKGIDHYPQISGDSLRSPISFNLLG